MLPRHLYNTTYLASWHSRSSNMQCCAVAFICHPLCWTLSFWWSNGCRTVISAVKVENLQRSQPDMFVFVLLEGIIIMTMHMWPTHTATKRRSYFRMLHQQPRLLEQANQCGRPSAAQHKHTDSHAEVPRLAQVGLGGLVFVCSLPIGTIATAVARLQPSSFK